MFRVTCRLFDGSAFVENTKNPRECIVRFFTSYADEVMDVEVKYVGEEPHERRQLEMFGER